LRSSQPIPYERSAARSEVKLFHPPDDQDASTERQIDPAGRLEHRQKRARRGRTRRAAESGRNTNLHRIQYGASELSSVPQWRIYTTSVPGSVRAILKRPSRQRR